MGNNRSGMRPAMAVITLLLVMIGVAPGQTAVDPADTAQQSLQLLRDQRDGYRASELLTRQTLTAKITEKEAKIAELEAIIRGQQPDPVLTESPSGAKIPPATQIIDKALSVWTLNAAEGGKVYRDNALAGHTNNVDTISYVDGVIYQHANGRKWSWTQGAWKEIVAPIPPPPDTTPLPVPAGKVAVVGINAGDASAFSPTVLAELSRVFKWNDEEGGRFEAWWNAGWVPPGVPVASDPSVKVERTSTGYKIRGVAKDAFEKGLKVWMPGYEPGGVHEGEKFYGPALASLRPFSGLRGLDALGTNDSSVVTWEDWTRWRRGVMDVRDYLDLCALLDADAWIPIPHLADDNLIRQLALEAKARMKPGRKTYLEYSNEVWNTEFTVWLWAHQGWELYEADVAKARAAYNATDRSTPEKKAAADAVLNTALKAATNAQKSRPMDWAKLARGSDRVFRIGREVLGDDAVNVIAGQRSGLSNTKKIYALMQEKALLDVVSCSWYFAPSSSVTAAWPADMQAPAIVAATRAGLSSDVVEDWRDWAAWGRSIGAGFEQYEGGSHLDPPDSAKWMGQYILAHESEAMAEVYEFALTTAIEAGSRRVWSYKHAGKITQYGPWPIFKSDFTPRPTATRLILVGKTYNPN